MIKLYSMSTCPKCDIVKGKFKDLGISYKEVTDKAELEANGIKGVPVLEFKNGERAIFQDILRLLATKSNKLKE